ncbi:MAG: nitrogen fixation protein FixF [Pseudomonadota bacterium]
MRFFKLDTGVIRNFDTALQGEVEVFSTSLLSVLRSHARDKGAFQTALLVVQTLLGLGAPQKDAVSGNLLRKKIRLPAVFGNPLIGGIYGAIKRFEAGILHNALKARLAVSPPETVIIYNGSNYPESVLAGIAESHSMRRVYVEAGFFPGTLQIDPIGLNAANSIPRDPAFYLNTSEDFAATGLPQAVNNRASKTVGAGEVTLEPGYVFVPFQVPSDMQVTLHSPWIQSMEDFLDEVIAAADRHPDERFVIKEHPSFKRSVQGLRPEHPRVVFANDNVTSELIQNARVLVTLNSTVGIEALLLDRPVITLGAACYNVEGLVQHAPDHDRLDAALDNRDWVPSARLRRQYLGYLWNVYLMHGRYDDLPGDLGGQLLSRSS